MKLSVVVTNAERLTLEEMADHHPFGDVRVRALGVLGVLHGRKPADLAEVLRVTVQTVYNWSHAWKNIGLMGLLCGHEGGRRRKISDAQLDTAIALAQEEPRSLRELAEGVAQALPEAPAVSPERLGFWLKRRGLVYRRTRLSLKKSARLLPSRKQRAL